MAKKRRKTEKPRPASETGIGPSLSALVLICFFLSGAAGLIYEILWIRMIDKVVGSAPFAVATVLAVFMGGLALGSYLAGRYIDRIPSKSQLLSLYGKLELVIGVYGLLLPFLTVAVKPLYSVAYNHLFPYFWVYQIFNFLGCSLLLIFPAVLMGVTLPVLCRFYVAHLDHLGTRTGRLYGLNTVGAAVGAFLCGFVLVGTLGVWGALFVAAGINFLVGGLCILMARRPLSVSTPGKFEKKRRDTKSLKEPAVAKDVNDTTVFWALCIFALSGFSAMAYEVIWTRLLGLIIGPTTYSFTLVVATFIVGLAVGSLFFGWLGDRVKRTFLLLVGTQIAAAFLALLVSQFLGNSQLLFAKLIYTFQGQFEKTILAQILVVFVIMLSPTVFLGATFPLVNRIYARSLSGLGKSIGTAYALNTVGAILGSVVAGFILIPFLGKENGLRLVTAIQFMVPACAVVVLTIKSKEKTKLWIGPAAAAVVGVFVFVQYPSWDRGLLSSGRYRNFGDMENLFKETSWSDAILRGATILKQVEPDREIVFYGDGIGGFTTVEKVIGSLGNEKYTMVNSGKPDASSHGDRSNQTLLAHIPLLFHPKPEKVLVIGLASGMTAGEALHYPVQALDVVEISDQVVKASDFFKPWNNTCLDDPRTRLIVQDGRNHLALTTETYDVIISGPSNPWMAGLANLFTKEFFQSAKERLQGDGIFVQWMQSYEMNWPTFALAGRAFMEVFPDGWLMRTSPADYIFVGFLGKPELRSDVAQERLQYANRSTNIALPQTHVLFQLVVTEDLKRLMGDGPVHTDHWPHLEFAAPKQLNTNDFSIEKRMAEKRWMSTRTKEIARAGRDSEGRLDLAAFMASVGSPFFSLPRYDDLNDRQQERYARIMRRFCSEELVLNYEVFSDAALRQDCAQLQAEKIRAHLTSHPENATAQYNLGNTLIQQGDLESAIQHFSEAVRLKPDYTKAYYNLAIACYQTGKYQRAIEHCDAAMALGAKIPSQLLDLLAPHRR